MQTETIKFSTTFPRAIQNYLLIWLNSNADDENENDDDQNIVIQLRQIVHNVNLFNNKDQCIDFLTDVQNEKIFMIVSNDLSEQILPLIHDFACLNTIFIFSKNRLIKEQWTNNYSKVKGVYTQMSMIDEALKRSVEQCEQDTISISFVPLSDIGSKPNLNELDPLFMYTQILKEILFEIKFDEQSIKNFTTNWRKHFTNNDPEISFIDEFERDYPHHLPIWWYTRPSILYSMLNRALRLMETDIIVQMGFFIRALHENIKQIHAKQYSDHQNVCSFIVFRGQGLSITDFNKLKKSKGGLMSFNNFLSTTSNRDVAFLYADSNQMNSDSIGVLLEITIDPSVTSTPFASLRNISYFSNEEEEILFSMHAIFRINNIKQLNDNSEHLWQVELTLTGDSDEQLQLLTDQIREETHGTTSWIRLGLFLMKVNQLEQAEQLYITLLNQMTNDKNKGHLYGQLGCIKDEQGYHKEAIILYEKALEYRQKYLHPNHPELAIFYRNVGMSYFAMGDYSKACLFYEKALEIRKNILPANHRDLALSYGNLASVYFCTGDYSKAIEFFEKELDINEQILVPNHPDLAIVYDNVGATYYGIGKYSKALLFYRKALEIKEKTLPSNHTDLADSLYGIGTLYDELGQSAQAIPFLEKALVIFQRTLSSQHHKIISTYNSIGVAYAGMNNYSEALSFCTKAIEISEQTVPLNKHHLAFLYNNTGMIYIKMNEYSEALAFYQRALENLQETPYSNQQQLAMAYNNIAVAYYRMGECSKALLFSEKAYEICRTTLPLDHPSFAYCFNNMAGMLCSMGDYSKALVYYEKALEICQKTLPSNHPHLLLTYNSIATVYDRMGNYSQAFFFYGKAHTIEQ